LLPFPMLTQQGPDVIAWTLAGTGLMPNLQQLRVADGTPTVNTSWSVLLPGSSRQMAMPAPVKARLQSGTHQFTITDSLSPNFDFHHWTDADLGPGGWPAYSYAGGSFTVP